jgi:hypothetical protein
MGLGTAVLILGLIYFYFKEPRFRKVVHVCAIVALCGCIAFGLWYLKTEHDTKVREEARQAAEAKETTEQAAKLAKTCADWERNHPVGSPLDRSDDKKIIWDPPKDCSGPLEDAYIAQEPKPWEQYAASASRSTKPNATLTRTYGYATVGKDGATLFERCGFYTGTLPCSEEYTSSRVKELDGQKATLKSGDRLELLSLKRRAENGQDIYKVRTAQGWTGWVNASDVE